MGNWQFQLLRKAETARDLCFVFPFIGRRLRHFQDPSWMSTRRTRADLIQELKKLLCSITAFCFVGFANSEDLAAARRKADSRYGSP
jgi:hypothetical protein